MMNLLIRFRSLAKCVLGRTGGDARRYIDKMKWDRWLENAHVSPNLREVGMPNHFSQARFYDFNVYSNEKRFEKLRYMHRNSVKRGLVSSPELWPWSSFRAYMYAEPSENGAPDW